MSEQNIVVSESTAPPLCILKKYTISGIVIKIFLNDNYEDFNAAFILEILKKNEINKFFYIYLKIRCYIIQISILLDINVTVVFMMLIILIIAYWVNRYSRFQFNW